MLIPTWEMSLARNLVSDDERAFCEGFIRAVRHPNGRKPADHHIVLNGILWWSAGRHRFGVQRVARTAALWRDLPEEFGRWSSVCRQFRRWTSGAVGGHPGCGSNHAGIASDKLPMVDIEQVRHHRFGWDL